MKRCPVCKTLYGDEANFCPMDASGLDDLPAEGPSLDLPTMQARIFGGRFKAGPQIGGKRTGEVFSGEDISNGQPCAVKVVLPAVFPTPLVAQRTERELKQLMKVSSDRITKVLDVGKTGDRMYVAMELISGVTLAEILATEGALPPDQAARLGSEIGEGLAEAAKLGVIHRDVAPKNMMVLADARGPRRVKLLNFGVPTPVADKVLGIPEFLSPEQAEGKPVDQRSNIYSMGALLYTMLTGAPPFTGTVEEVLRQQVGAAVVPPTQRPTGRSIPPELERLVLKALEKASSRRHLTLRQLLGELDAISAKLPLSHPVTVEPPRAAVPAGTGRSTGAVQAQRPPTEGTGRRERHSAAKTIVGMPFSAAMLEARPGAPPATAAASVPAPVPAPVPAAQVPAATLAAAAPARAPDAEPATVPVQKHAADELLPPALSAAVTSAPPTVEPAIKPATKVATATRDPDTKRADVARKSTPGSNRRAASAQDSSNRKKSKFRETMWFKKGEAESENDGIDEPDERYSDDGTVTAADRDRLSLRTGDTAMLDKMEARPLPGDAMGEDDLVREMKGGNTRLFVIIASVLIAVALVLVYVLAIR